MSPGLASNAFAYRSPRVEARFPLEFRSGKDVLLGWTRNISDRGLMVQFAEPVMRDVHGRVRLTVGHCTLELDATVVHSEGFGAGFHFLFASRKERDFLAAVLHVISHG